ncbi:MAG: PilZ domain-containing protein [Nitrospirae bacterium]|nr:PilZ domain-containing protein [Nitrospirota bacterium]
MTFNDRRKSLRVAKRLEVKFNSTAENTAITNDLSANGMFIATCKGIEPGSTIDIKLNLPNAEALTISGKVIRSIKPVTPPDAGMQKGMGVEIMAPPSDYINYIQSLLE